MPVYRVSRDDVDRVCCDAYTGAGTLTCAQGPRSVTEQYNSVPATGHYGAVMSYGWEGNRRSGVALGMRQ